MILEDDLYQFEKVDAILSEMMDTMKEGGGKWKTRWFVEDTKKDLRRCKEIAQKMFEEKK
jgi:hypothetical protein